MKLNLPILTPTRPNETVPDAPAPARVPRPRRLGPSVLARPLRELPLSHRRIHSLPAPAPEDGAEESLYPCAEIPDIPVRVIRLTLTDGKTRVDCLECLHDLRDTSSSIYKEQLVQGVEMLFMQGVSAIREIRHIYNVSEEQAIEARDEVRNRFNATGGLINVRAARGEMLLKYEYLEQKLWGDYKGAVYQKDKNGIIQNLLTVLDRKAALSGLTAEQINKVLEVKSDSDVVARMGKQDGLLDLFGRLCDKVEEIQERERGEVLDV